MSLGEWIVWAMGTAVACIGVSWGLAEVRRTRKQFWRVLLFSALGGAFSAFQVVGGLVHGGISCGLLCRSNTVILRASDPGGFWLTLACLVSLAASLLWLAWQLWRWRHEEAGD